MKRPEKNKRNRSIVAVEVTTGIVHRFMSLIEAKKATNTSTVTMCRCAENVKYGNGYVWANPDDEQCAIDIAEYLKKTGYHKSQLGRPKKKVGLVWLQLDSHTRILVNPGEATPEFAIFYKKKIKK